MGHNLVGRASAQLDTLGGLVDLASPESLPEGASPRNQNMDYAVGGTTTRNGLSTLFSFSGNSQTDSASSAADGGGGNVVWQNPSAVLVNDASYASAAIGGSPSQSSSTSTGTSSGGGVAWTNPQNIDSVVSYATVNLAAGGSSYTPSTNAGIAQIHATSGSPVPSPQTTILSGFSSVPTTSATLYITISGSITAYNGGGSIVLQYSVDNGAHWSNVSTWTSSFSSSSIPVSISPITNLDTVQISITAAGSCSPLSGSFANVSVSVTNWYATIASGAGLTAQTLSAAVSGLSIPSGAMIMGLGISFVADYATTSPSFQIGLNVGNVEPSFTLTTSPGTYSAGGAGSLWGYSNWTSATLSSLVVNFFASAGGTSTISVNNLIVTVYYTSPAQSNNLVVEQFGFSIPVGKTLQGIAVNLTGYGSNANILATVQLLKAGVAAGAAETNYLNPTTPLAQVFGGNGVLWGTTWSPADLNSTSFGVQVSVSGSGTGYLGYITVTAFFAPQQANFNYVATYEDDFGNIKNVALDALGDWWFEDVTNQPGVLQPLSDIENVPAGTFASSFTQNSRQYIAMSDLSQGVYPPQQYTDLPSWSDRVSQVGPGAPPSFAATLNTGGTASITAYSASGGILTLTAANTFSAGEVVTITAGVGDGLNPLNGLSFNVLGTGLSTSQFEISTGLVTGSGSSTATATSQYTYPIATSPNGITQYASQPMVQTQFDAILWSAGAGSTNSGNVITIYYDEVSLAAQGDTVLNQAFQQGLFPVYVYVSGTNLSQANGTWLVTAVGQAVPPGGSASRNFFSFSISQTGYKNLGGGANSQPGRYQMTVATINTTLPLPGVQTGDQVTLTGNTVSSWNQTWQVVDALNSGSYAISQTSMASGVATYNWQLSGATSNPPAVGELVTITGCLNGDGVFNVTDAVISSVTGTSSGTFEVSGFANQTFAAQSETAQATTSGTKFQIDPGPLTVGTASNPIYGASGSGYITIVGSTVVTVGAGTRRGVVFFITRNGYWCHPSPYAQFTVPQNSNYILVSNIPIGPPEVVARGIAFTEAGQNDTPGANYYTIPDPVSFVYNGVTYLSSSLIINDNTTTSAKLTFTDAVLLDAQEIDIQGANLFNMVELGDAAWCTQYANRTIWGRVRNKIPNFLNLSFDGGYIPNPGGDLEPLGWSVAAGSAAAAYLTLNTSPIYGDSLYIQNTSGGLLAQCGLIYQSAYQDQDLVAILQPQTMYSVRVTCRTPSSSINGALVVDLTSYNSNTGFGQTYGTYTLGCSAMTSSMATYSGTMLATPFSGQVPADLQLRVWAQNLPNGSDIDIDRIEIFPTIAPTNFTDLVVSYANNPEAFDGVTGSLTTTNINAQPANGAFVMRGRLYVMKESSMGFFSESQGLEPGQWQPYEEVSNVAGACGINAFDVGEEWAIMANQNGLFAFNGGAPTPVMLEIPNLWNAINWNAAQSICVRNDFPNRRIYIACPMTTPNVWLPYEPAVTNPTYNNVVIMLNWQGIATIEGLMMSEAVHVTMMGSLAALDLRRKFSPWTIKTPYMGWIKRSELESEMAFCDGGGQSFISSLTGGQGYDNGTAFRSLYTTYGFVDQKKAMQMPIFGLFKKRFIWWDLQLAGSGNTTVRFLQDKLAAPYPFVVPGGVAPNVNVNDFAGPLDVSAMRCFIEVSTTAGWFACSAATLTGRADSWAPIVTTTVVAGQ